MVYIINLIPFDNCTPGTKDEIIPFDASFAVVTAPSFVLFIEPCINTHFLLAVNIGQHLTVVKSVVVVKIGDNLAGKVRALAATGNPLFRGAILDITLTACPGQL